MPNFQVMVTRNPDEWEGVTAGWAEVGASGALTFFDDTGHVISYGPHAWLTYWEESK